MPTMKTDNPSLRPEAGFGRADPIRPNQKAAPDKATDSREIQKPGLEVTNDTRKQTAVPEGLPPTFGMPSPRPPLLRGARRLRSTSNSSTESRWHRRPSRAWPHSAAALPFTAALAASRSTRVTNLIAG